MFFAMVSMFVGLSMTASHPESSLAKPASKPNIIFILTDDMRKDDLNARYMPKTHSLLASEGMSFQNAFVSTPLCCPSRATTMRGQYAHNTGIWYNVNVFNPDGPDGGWEGYQRNGYEEDNVATHLDADAGYRTGLFGKYLNNYSGTTVPSGWDDWFAFLDPIRYYDYDVNDNGTTTHFGASESDYSTDVISVETQQFIDASVDAGEPFFAYVAPKAPHAPATPAPRHQHDFDGEQAPRLPSFNEEDVSDKPAWIQSLRRLNDTRIAEIDERHEQRVESLRSVDDLVGGVVDKLQSRQVLDNTYIVFTSDNGWYHGEHRIRQGKGRPYEEAPRVPLVIRGPGVQAGSTTDKLALNTDLLPTFTDLAGAATPSYVDGRSLRSVLEESATTWRTAILLEGRAGNDPEIPLDRNYNGIRTSTSKYVEYEGGFRELYDLNPDDDPYELTNIYYSADPNAPPLSDLKARLEALKQCTGTGPTAPSCKVAEDTSKVPEDTIRPTVTAVAPLGKRVSPTANVYATFSEEMDANTLITDSATLKSTNIVLKKGTTMVAAKVTLDSTGIKATLNPNRNLREGAIYTATVSSGAQDLAGNTLVARSWRFTVRR
jgi:N-acetylglucosamine-6-sulfatase